MKMVYVYQVQSGSMALVPAIKEEEVDMDELKAEIIDENGVLTS